MHGCMYLYLFLYLYQYLYVQACMHPGMCAYWHVCMHVSMQTYMECVCGVGNGPGHAQIMIFLIKVIENYIKIRPGPCQKPAKIIPESYQTHVKIRAKPYQNHAKNYMKIMQACWQVCLQASPNQRAQATQWQQPHLLQASAC